MAEDKTTKKQPQPPPPEPKVEWYPGVSNDDWEAARKKAVEDAKKEQQYTRR